LARQVLRPDIDLDPRYNTGVAEDVDKWPAVLGLLADRLVVEDGSADALAKPGRGDEEFALGSPRRFRLRDAEPGEAPVAGGRAFVHRQQAFVASD